VTEGDLVAQSAEFEAAVAGGDPGALAALCDVRAGGAAGEDAETWGFMRMLFCEEDGRRCAAARPGARTAYHALRPPARRSPSCTCRECEPGD